MTFLYYFYLWGLCSLTLGVVLRPEKARTDFNAHWGPWLIGPIVFTALAIWPLTIILYTGLYLKNKLVPSRVTPEEEDLFLQLEWQETNGKGIIKSKDEPILPPGEQKTPEDLQETFKEVTGNTPTS